MFRTTEAGALHATIVFLIGFTFGIIRVLLLVLRLGETTAVIFEAPIDGCCELAHLPLVLGSAQREANGVQVWRRFDKAFQPLLESAHNPFRR